MSYDLFFHRTEGQKPLSLEEFKEHFHGRNHFQLNESQAWYQNEDTGVYFSFDYTDASETDNEEEDEEEAPTANASFNMNYYRPHTFGLEAEPEVSHFVKTLSLLIDDPQFNGMGRGEYSRAGFLDGWNAGNKVGYQAIISMGEPDKPLNVLPSAKIEDYWRWNYERAALAAELEEQLIIGFVPTIMFIRHQDRVRSFVVWTDEVITLLPAVDLIVLNRDPSKKSDLALLEWAELAPVLAQFKKITTGPLEYLLPQFEEVPPEIWKFIAHSGKPVKGKLNGLSTDEILDQELVEECRPK